MSNSDESGTFARAGQTIDGGDDSIAFSAARSRELRLVELDMRKAHRVAAAYLRGRDGVQLTELRDQIRKETGFDIGHGLVRRFLAIEGFPHEVKGFVDDNFRSIYFRRAQTITSGEIA